VKAGKVQDVIQRKLLNSGHIVLYEQPTKTNCSQYTY